MSESNMPQGSKAFTASGYVIKVNDLITFLRPFEQEDEEQFGTNEFYVPFTTMLRHACANLHAHPHECATFVGEVAGGGWLFGLATEFAQQVYENESFKICVLDGVAFIFSTIPGEPASAASNAVVWALDKTSIGDLLFFEELEPGDLEYNMRNT